MLPIFPGIFNLFKCQHFEILYSRNANKHITIVVYIIINDNYRSDNTCWNADLKIKIFESFFK
jgi:hypothetical protein